MADYQLELRQIVDYPRCRIYREFMQTLIADRSIRTGGCSGLFYYVVLCAYANFRTSYKQYAVDTVIKKPFTAPDGEIDYHKEIVKKMPDPPKRKDRM